VQETEHKLDTFPRLLVKPFCASQVWIFNLLDHTDKLLPDVLGRYCGLIVH
jgi:hypothetical protein